MATTVRKTEVIPYEKVRTYYRRREALFGLLRWYEEVKTDSFGKELHILCDEEVKEVFVNGKKIIL